MATVISREQHALNLAAWMAEHGLPPSKRTNKQVKRLGPVPIGDHRTITAEIRWDDNCGNGVNSFAITADIYKGSVWESGGCLHDEIRKAFPEYAHLIKWHLMMADGPMHYIANTVYLAGDRDAWKRRKGEPSRFEYGFRFGGSPITHRVKQRLYGWVGQHRDWDTPKVGYFGVQSFAHDREPKTFKPAWTLAFNGEIFGARWHECPFHDEQEAREFAASLNTCSCEFVQIPVEISEGKARELDAARNAAVWPEATDEQLSAEPAELEAALLARLPALMQAFKEDIEALGFTY